MRRRFLTAPVDERNLDDWTRLGSSLRAAIRKACPRVDIEVGEQPVFGPGIDLEETVLELEEQHLTHPPRTARLDLWCSIEGYGAICCTTGDGLVRKERRALEKALAKTLRGEVLIHETEGPFDLASARVHGYRLDPDDDRDRVTFAHLVAPFDPPLYVGERWLLQGDDERIDPNRFEVSRSTPGQVVQFVALEEEAEERVWRHATRGEGLVALFTDDDHLADITRGFPRRDDLRVLSGLPWSYRVTLGRGGGEGESLAVTYDTSVPPVEEAELAFAI